MAILPLVPLPDLSWQPERLAVFLKADLRLRPRIPPKISIAVEYARTIPASPPNIASTIASPRKRCLRSSQCPQQTYFRSSFNAKTMSSYTYSSPSRIHRVEKFPAQLIPKDSKTSVPSDRQQAGTYLFSLFTFHQSQ
jgi:hypothetical protein